MTGVSVREYGTVVPLGADGSYMVFERLDNTEAIKRRGGSGRDAADTMKRIRALGTLGEVRRGYQVLEDFINLL